ncbi:MAG: methyltransferase domain-containing protein [Bacteroidia bacterium]|nr:methyltransferase domain-containing protein [Bacteroidia bacterium]
MNTKLLNKEELAWSPIVANNSMNRERQAIGINSYEKDIGLNPLDFLLKNSSQEKVRWLDLCCGKGNALIQTANILEEKGGSDQFELSGIDLVDFFSDPANLRIDFQVQNLESWMPQKEYDLISIVHGLHYVGDKISLVERAISALSPQGLFIANLDLENIKIQAVNQPKKLLSSFFKKNKLEYNARKKIISSDKRKIDTSGFHYLGADDKAGPNYTGQEVVNSYYALK